MCPLWQRAGNKRNGVEGCSPAPPQQLPVGRVLHHFQSGYGVNPKGVAGATELWVGKTGESQAVM